MLESWPPSLVVRELILGHLLCTTSSPRVLSPLPRKVTLSPEIGWLTPINWSPGPPPPGQEGASSQLSPTSHLWSSKAARCPPRVGDAMLEAFLTLSVPPHPSALAACPLSCAKCQSLLVKMMCREPSRPIRKAINCNMEENPAVPRKILSPCSGHSLFHTACSTE